MKSFLAVLSMFLICGLTACSYPPEFAVPLSTPSEVEPDERLIGDWYTSEKDNEKDRVVWLVRVSRDRKKSTNKISWVWLANQLDDPPTLVFNAFPSIVDGLTFYNLKRVHASGSNNPSAGEPSGYIIVKPVLLDDDILLVCVLHGEGWQNSDAKEMFELAGMPYREAEPSGRLFVDVTERDMHDLVQDPEYIKMFHAYFVLGRVGHKPVEPEGTPNYPNLEKHIKDHGCPLEGWPLKS